MIIKDYFIVFSRGRVYPKCHYRQFFYRKRLSAMTFYAKRLSTMTFIQERVINNEFSLQNNHQHLPIYGKITGYDFFIEKCLFLMSSLYASFKTNDFLIRIKKFVCVYVFLS